MRLLCFDVLFLSISEGCVLQSYATKQNRYVDLAVTTKTSIGNDDLFCVLKLHGKTCLTLGVVVNELDVLTQIH